MPRAMGKNVVFCGRLLTFCPVPSDLRLSSYPPHSPLLPLHSTLTARGKRPNSDNYQPTTRRLRSIRYPTRRLRSIRRSIALWRQPIALWRQLVHVAFWRQPIDLWRQPIAMRERRPGANTNRTLMYSIKILSNCGAVTACSFNIHLCNNIFIIASFILNYWRRERAIGGHWLCSVPPKFNNVVL